MSDATDETGASTWPADVTHGNEDGWVLINRGLRAGASPGPRMLVVGAAIRELRNLFPAGGGAGGASTTDQPIVLRTRRTYEQLDVVYAEADCAIAIATASDRRRTPNNPGTADWPPARPGAARARRSQLRSRASPPPRQ